MLDRLIDLLIECLGLFRFWHIVDPYEEALVLRFGKLHRHLKPGFNWVIPLGVETALSEHTVPAIHSLGNESVTTVDGKSIAFHAIVTFQVRDIEKLLLKVEDGNHAVMDACSGEVARILRQSTLDEINKPDMLDKLTDAARKRGFRYGVEIMSVQLASMTVCRAIRIMGEMK